MCIRNQHTYADDNKKDTLSECFKQDPEDVNAFDNKIIEDLKCTSVKCVINSIDDTENQCDGSKKIVLCCAKENRTTKAYYSNHTKAYRHNDRHA